VIDAVIVAFYSTSKNGGSLNISLGFKRKLSNLIGDFAKLDAPLWAIFFIQIVVRGGDFVFPFLALFLTKRLGFSTLNAGVWIMGTSAVGLFGTLIMGYLSDHFGRKMVLTICMIINILLLASCGFQSETIIPRILLAASFFQGAMKPLISALVMDFCPIGQRREAFSLSYLGTNLGVAIGPMVAAFLFENHLRFLFLGNAFALSCALIILFLFVANNRLNSQAPEAVLEQIFAGRAFDALLARPTLLTFYSLTIMISFAYSQTSFGLAMYTRELFGSAGTSYFGLLMSFNAITVLASTALVLRFIQRTSMLGAMTLGTFLYTIGFGMLVFPLTMIPMLISTFIWTQGEVLLAINTGPFIASQTPSNFRGRFQALREIMWGVGSSLSPLLCGAVMTKWGVHTSWLVTSLVVLVSSIVFFILYRNNTKQGIVQ
jgi:MFS family permease